jgi:glucose/arabinose dehydrogenase
MKRSSLLIIALMVLLVLLIAGCKAQEAAPEQVASPTNTNQGNTNAPQAVPAPTEAKPDSPPPKLNGNYVLNEVQYMGQVTTITAGDTTEFSFRPDGTYERVSRRNGRVDHSDSGMYGLEGADKLILRIQMSDKKIQVPFVEKRHTFKLSPDGSELNLAGADGKIGIFRRTRVFAGR